MSTTLWSTGSLSMVRGPQARVAVPGRQAEGGVGGAVASEAASSPSGRGEKMVGFASVQSWISSAW